MIMNEIFSNDAKPNIVTGKATFEQDTCPRCILDKLHFSCKAKWTVTCIDKLQDACDTNDMLYTWCFAWKTSGLLHARNYILPLL